MGLLKHRIKSIVNGALGFGEHYLERKVRLSELTELLRTLRPYQSGIPLVRIGSQADGGYLLPDDFLGISRCISPGCAGLWGFEKQLWESHGIPSVICDRENMKPLDLPKEFSYVDAFIGFQDDTENVTLQSLVDSNCEESENDLILQMDIEGSEYLSILATPQSTLKKFRIILLELHYLEDVNKEIYTQNIFRPFLQRITKDHTVVHFHPNNCCGTWKRGSLSFPRTIEITLLRNDRLKTRDVFATIPNSLDQPNLSNSKDLFFDFGRI
jgi:hypothetical protein